MKMMMLAIMQATWWPMPHREVPGNLLEGAGGGMKAPGPMPYLEAATQGPSAKFKRVRTCLYS